MVEEKEVEDFLVKELKKQDPEGIRKWLHGEESMVDLVIKHRKMLRMLLKLNKGLRERLERLNYDEVVKNVVEVYPELEQEFKDEKVRAKIESEIVMIKKLLLG